MIYATTTKKYMYEYINLPYILTGIALLIATAFLKWVGSKFQKVLTRYWETAERKIEQFETIISQQQEMIGAFGELSKNQEALQIIVKTLTEKIDDHGNKLEKHADLIHDLKKNHEKMGDQISQLLKGETQNGNPPSNQQNS